MTLLHHDAAAVARALPPKAAADVLEAALCDGLDPEGDPPRTRVAAGTGELLMMPSVAPGRAGVKLVTVGGEPRVQGVYVLFDAGTLAPLATIDGIALTNLRTAAVSALAVRHLATPDARRLLVFGSGPQAWAHVRAIAAERPIEHVDVVARDRARRQAFVVRLREEGLQARVAEPRDVVHADVVCCATTARRPLFDGDLPPDHVTAVAVGAHEPDARELPGELLARAGIVVVESRASASKEAGDVVLATAEGRLAEADLVTLSALARGTAAPYDPTRPRVFKSTGMAWEDLVVAAAVHARA